ncbi:PAS and ANTAR domain-containing protein [Alloalcanivorax gelatiniphagus]
MTEGAAGQGFKAPHAALVGRYTYRPDTDEWWWSDSMYRIHGFEPGAVVPTTELVMRHISPADVEAAWESREGVVERQEPFSFLHRIVTATGDCRVVLAAGHLDLDDGTPVVSGHLVDVTDVRREAVDVELEKVVGDFLDHRAVIEQAKGVLVQLYSVDADTAWLLLRAFSTDSNRKVRDIAQRLVAAAGDDRTPVKHRSPSAHDMLERLYADADADASAPTASHR